MIFDSGITDGIMNRKQLRDIGRKIEEYRRSQPKAKDLEALAKALGRKLANRGKEPTFASTEFPYLRPLSIPNHKGRDLAIGTKNSILVQMEDDMIEWDERLSEKERQNRGGQL